jgi:hypothetical protein
MPTPYSIRSQRGLADFDVRQAFNATASWTLPAFGRGLAHRLFGDWSPQSVIQVQTGFPFNPRVGFDRARMRSGFGDLDQRPSLASAVPPVILGDPARYYDPMSFILPQAGYLGDLGRNTLPGLGCSPRILACTSRFGRTSVRTSGSGSRLSTPQTIRTSMSRPNSASLRVRAGASAPLAGSPPPARRRARFSSPFIGLSDAAFPADTFTRPSRFSPPVKGGVHQAWSEPDRSLDCQM